jgi:ABC-type nickel/cobalt efflux system permease component RcnA
MRRWVVTLTFLILLGGWIGPVHAQNPFTSRSAKTDDIAPAPKAPFTKQLYAKITVWQYQLKKKMSALIRGVKKDGRVMPLLLLMGLAVTYGAVHAAGPGHGKFVAMSYVLSHRPTIPGGILFAVCIAGLHGFSGAVGVLGLRLILQKGVGETLSATTNVTQVASFGLITLLGLGIALKGIHSLWLSPAVGPQAPPRNPSRKGLLPWVAAVGLVPCPAVVMVMLFCMSMEALILGLLLAACISSGMAATISFVVVAVVLGKSGVLSKVPEKRVHVIEGVLGVFSGAAVCVFGALLLFSTLHALS